MQGLTSCSQTSTCHEARDDCIPCIFLLSPSLHRTIKRRKHSSPNAKVASRYWRTGFDSGDGANKSFALQREVEHRIRTSHTEMSRRVNACRRTFGEFRAPLIPCQIPPPTAPIANAPPKSLRMTHGLKNAEIDNDQNVLRQHTRDPVCDLRGP